MIGTSGSTIVIGTFIFGTIVIGTNGDTVVIGIIVSKRNRIVSYARKFVRKIISYARIARSARRGTSLLSIARFVSHAPDGRATRPMGKRPMGEPACLQQGQS